MSMKNNKVLPWQTLRQIQIWNILANDDLGSSRRQCYEGEGVCVGELSLGTQRK